MLSVAESYKKQIQFSITNKETTGLVVVDIGVQARLCMDGQDMLGLTYGGL